MNDTLTFELPATPRNGEAGGCSSALICSAFRCIVADPPWPYGTSKTGRWVIPKNAGQEHQRRVDQMGYNTMDMEQLLALPVRSLAHATSHLYLWTTNAFLSEAHDLARAWGYTPKTMLTWGKVKADGTPSMKTGYYFRGATEHCLFAVRGSQRLQVKYGKPTLYLSERLPHSRKPEWFYRLCEEVSPGPYLELFARRKRHGWASWGNEIANDVEMPNESSSPTAAGGQRGAERKNGNQENDRA